MTSVAAHVDPIIPLSVLEAVRSVDIPLSDELGELDDELVAKRLGMSRTVAREIARYSNLVRRRSRVEMEEVVGLLRLVGRRADAVRVFADAGQRAALYATTRLRIPARVVNRALPQVVSRRLGLVLARRALTRSLGAALSRDGDSVIVMVADSPSARATPEGTACGMYAAAVEAILESMTAIDWQVSHPDCRARGDELCRWHTAPERAA